MTYMTKDQACGGAVRLFNQIVDILEVSKDENFDDTPLSQMIDSVGIKFPEEDGGPDSTCIATVRLYDEQYRHCDNKGIYFRML